MNEWKKINKHDEHTNEQIKEQTNEIINTIMNRWINLQLMNQKSEQNNK